MGVFADDEVGEEANFFSKERKVIEGGDGNEEFVADALAVDHGASGPRFGESTFEEGDHGLGDCRNGAGGEGSTAEVGEADGKGIGFIGPWVMEKSEKGAGHESDLFFAGGASSGSRFFDEFGRVFMDGESTSGGGEKGDSAGGSEDDGGAGILHIDD